MVGQKIMGSMGPAKKDSMDTGSGGYPGPSTPASEATTCDSAPSQSFTATSTGRGTSLGVPRTASAPVGSSLGLENSPQEAGDGWGGSEDNFWDDFGDLPQSDPKGSSDPSPGGAAGTAAPA